MMRHNEIFFTRGKEKMVELHWGLYAFFEQQGAGYEIMGCTLSIRPQKVYTAHIKPVQGESSQNAC